MSADPQRFAQMVLGAFEAAGLFTDPQVIAAGGPSTSTMTLLRKVANPDDPTTMSEPREPTWGKVDKAAGWRPGSARAVWRGGDPTPATTPAHREQPTAEDASEFILRRLAVIEARLRNVESRLPPEPLRGVGKDGTVEPHGEFD